MSLAWDFSVINSKKQNYITGLISKLFSSFPQARCYILATASGIVKKDTERLKGSWNLTDKFSWLTIWTVWTLSMKWKQFQLIETTWTFFHPVRSNGTAYNYSNISYYKGYILLCSAPGESFYSLYSCGLKSDQKVTMNKFFVFCEPTPELGRVYCWLQGEGRVGGGGSEICL